MLAGQCQQHLLGQFVISRANKWAARRCRIARSLRLIAANAEMPHQTLLGPHVSETIDVAELSPLERAKYYRRLVEDAVRQARAASDETTRSAHQFRAEHWLKLAAVTEQTADMQDARLPAWETEKQDRSREER